jgi:hypothetical protein
VKHFDIELVQREIACCGIAESELISEHLLQNLRPLAARIRINQIWDRRHRPGIVDDRLDAR